MFNNVIIAALNRILPYPAHIQFFTQSFPEDHPVMALGQ
jgi:hypothetical protein